VYFYPICCCGATTTVIEYDSDLQLRSGLDWPCCLGLIKVLETGGTVTLFKQAPRGELITSERCMRCTLTAYCIALPTRGPYSPNRTAEPSRASCSPAECGFPPFAFDLRDTCPYPFALRPEGPSGAVTCAFVER
jgi:hypothetical protein